ncbi:MAG: YfhO family protein, partial [Ruminococcus sp.]|nr:YfhO family protein [Ruminococcus sp.]
EVNGKKVDVEKVSYGFMAVKAEAGENNIVFHYETPGLRYGIIISVSGIALLLGYLIIGFIIKKKSKNNEVGHTHYYDYESIQKIDASQEYIRSLIGKDKK